MDVPDLSVLPARGQTVGVGRHDVAVCGDAVGVEGGRREPALLQPELALARQQTVAEDRRDVTPEEAVLDEVGALRQQDRLDVLRRVDEEDLVSRQAHVHEIAVLAETAREKTEDVVREGGQIAEQPSAPRAGRVRPRRRRSGTADRLGLGAHSAAHPTVALAGSEKSLRDRRPASSGCALTVRLFPRCAPLPQREAPPLWETPRAASSYR